MLLRAHVGSGAMVAAGAVVAERAQVRPGTLSVGVPAAEKKQLSGSALEWTRKAAQEYQRYRERYLTASRVQAAEQGARPVA